MALIRCSKCSRLFADKKTICPHCDTPVDFAAIESKQREELKHIEANLRAEQARKLRLQGEELKYAKTNQQQEEVQSNTLSIALNWLFGVFLLMMAVIMLTSEAIIACLIYIIGGLFFLPPVRKIVYAKAKAFIHPLYSVGIMIIILFLGQNALQHVEAEAQRKQQEAYTKAKLEEKKAKSEKFKSEKNNILKQVQLQIRNKTYEEIFHICNEYADLNDKDLRPLCNQAIDANNKITELKRKKEEEEERRLAAQEPAKHEADIKTYIGAKAYKIHKKYPHWSLDDCIRVSRGEYWIGMSTDMMVASLGRPNSAKPSNYGAGDRWQYCYTEFQCFYDSNGDGIIDAYN